MGAVKQRVALRWRQFTSSELSSACLLVVATLIALAWANFGGTSYDDFWGTTFAVHFGDVKLDLDLQHWVNDFLMAGFFLLVSLEVKHDLVVGDLRDPKKATLPLIGAVAGLLIPAALFVLINPGSETTHAWGVVISTDTAFVVALLALFGSKIPGPLRAFLLTLAVADDVGALAVIAVVYTENLALTPLLVALALGAVLFFMQRAQVWRISFYMIIGIVIWLAVYASGVHATVAGVIVGLLVPIYQPHRQTVKEAESLTQTFRRTPTVATGRAAVVGIARSISMNARMQKMLHLYVVLLIVPIFALANAGVPINGEVLSQAIVSPLFWGILGGLVIGKCGGILGATIAITKLRIAEMPPGIRYRHIAGGAMLTGIGFTISLFIVDLAISDPLQQSIARIGVLVASFLAAMFGLGAFYIVTRYDRARAPARKKLVRPVDPAEDHILGPVHAPVQIVNYDKLGGTDDDLTSELVERLYSRFEEDISYVFRHNPRENLVAIQAAEALEAVALQSQRLFWRMHRELVKINAEEDLDAHEIRRAAVTVGAHLTRMEETVRRGETANRVERDVLDAKTMELRSTPHFFINGENYDGPISYEGLAAAIEAALDEVAGSEETVEAMTGHSQ